MGYRAILPKKGHFAIVVVWWIIALSQIHFGGGFVPTTTTSLSRSNFFSRSIILFSKREKAISMNSIPSQEFSTKSRESTEIILKRLNSTISATRPLTVPQDSSSPNSSRSTIVNSVVLALGSYAVASGLGELLVNFEAVQSWRYIWPFSIGSLYVFDAMMIQNENTTVIPIGPLAKSINPLLSAMLGVALIVGGAYDAFMPVWMTGPNVFTNAGIGQDAAAALFLVTISAVSTGIWRGLQGSRKERFIESSSSSSSSSFNEDTTVSSRRGTFDDDNNAHTNLLLLQSLLLGQLYKLGESSFDEIIDKGLTTLAMI